MNCNCKAVIVKKTEWKESSFIVRCFSNEYGFISFIAHGLKKNKSADKDNIQLYNEVELNLGKSPNAGLYVLHNSILISSYSSELYYNHFVILGSVFELLGHILINTEETVQVYQYLIRFLKYFKEVKKNFMIYFARFSFGLLSIINPHFLQVKCDYCHNSNVKIMTIDEENRCICEDCLKKDIEITENESLDSTLVFLLYHGDYFWKMNDHTCYIFQ